MGMVPKTVGRRDWLRAGAFVGSLYSVPGLFAEELTTPRMTEGPFYPDRLPLDTDNDLLILNDSLTPAVGEITYLSGRVLSAAGEPMRNAFVEIWQVDHLGSYLHTNGRGEKGVDANFQGYGRCLTNTNGEYFFRTIKPVRYQAGTTTRAPHIHVAVSRNGRRLLTTQMLIAGDPDNDQDAVLRGLRTPETRERVLVPFRPLQGSRLGELTARFEIILGVTPEDQDHEIRGGISKPDRSGG